MNQEYDTSTLSDIALLTRQRDETAQQLAKAIKVRNEMDGKMQSRYDTQKEEWALECNMLEDKLERIDQSIAQLRRLDASRVSIDRVSVGNTVTLILDDDEPVDFLLANAFGGQELSSRIILSVESPVGKAVLGMRQGDEFELELAGEMVYIRIVKIS